MNLVTRLKQGLSPARARLLRSAYNLFLALGVGALGYVGFVSANSHAYQAIEKEKFAQEPVLSEPRILRKGDVVGEIQVPRLGLDAIVIQGDSTGNLQRAVGHIASSALPGEWGNVALAGHRDSFFRPLRDIRLGDEIRFKTPLRSFEYRVESIEVVGPRDIQVLDPSSGHDLTLLTCFPFSFVGRAPGRFVVRAREVTGAN